MIIYNYNDMVTTFIAMLGEFTGKSILLYGYKHFSNYYIDGLSNLLVFSLSKIFHPINVYWIVIIFFLILNLYFSYKLVSSLVRSRFVSILISIIYSVSIYFLYRVASFTFNFLPVFLFPMTINLILQKEKPLYVVLCFFLAISLSSYYFYFLLVLVVMSVTFTFMYKKTHVLRKKHLPLLVLILLALFTCSYKISLNQNGNYNKGLNRIVYRPMEDWYNLSFRPWYFFIPPKSSVFFGELSKNIHKKIQDTGHYLADDYMEEEMAGSYMGWHFLLGMGVVAILLLIRKFKGKEFTTFKSVYENREIIYRSFFIIFCILLISGPPSFTIKGITIYTPTYLLYYIVPVFRTLVRWAVVIYLFVLIINSFLIQDLYNLMKNKFQKILFVVSFLSLNFVIFAVKIPVININKPPQEIAFVKEKYSESVPYAVYPKGDYYSIFWAISHKDLLINPVNLVNYETGFDSNEFSKNLVTQEGVEEFLKHTPKYLIYYPENISDKDLEKINKINSNLKTREDIRDFFEKEIGIITYVGNVIIFEVR